MGCCHQQVYETFGMRRKGYGGTKAAYLQDNTIFIDCRTMTKRLLGKDCHINDSYMKIQPQTKECLWVDPGSLSSILTNAVPLTFNDGFKMNLSDYKKDFLSGTNTIVVYQQYIFIREPDQKKVTSIYYWPGGTTWRDKSAYPEYYIVYTGAWVVDIATSPFYAAFFIVSHVAGAFLSPVAGWRD